MKSRHFISIADVPQEDLQEIFSVTEQQKYQLATEGGLAPALRGRTLAMLFEKPSLRTRVSFEVAMTQLGGHVTTLSQSEVSLGQRESVTDFARVLSRYVDVIAVRVFRHAHVVEMARGSRVPVINALSDYTHPCQALADLWTLKEHKGKWEGLKLVFVGDGNNVARSLAFLCARLGVRFGLVGPEDYLFDEATVKKVHARATHPKFAFEMGADPKKVLRGADAVYTDVWASMGQETEREVRRKAFAGYQVNRSLLRLARRDAVVMHCLPAHRGEEITDEAIDGPNSVVYDQAENRLHTQRALLSLLVA
jgi:ornithine carbamoyltransferase